MQELYESLAGFRLALRRFLRQSEAALADAGITSQQYQVMLAIQATGTGKLKVKDIATEMLMQQHGAVQLVDRLCTSGLVERVASAHDRRIVMVGLTETGRSVLAALAQIHAKALLKSEPLLLNSLSQLRRLDDLA